MGDTQIVTWNVNGLLDRIKRGAVLSCLKRMGPEVAMLQKTHLMGTKCEFLGRFGFNRVYHAGFARGSRGVAIILKKSFPFAVLGSRSDPLGRFVAVWGKIDGEAYNFVSVYMPPHLHAQTLRDLGEIILDLPPGVLVMGGDCNAMLNRELDFSRGASDRIQSADTRFKAWMQSMGLCDLWRTWNPHTRQYTHTSAAHHTQSRIDYFLMPATDIGKTTGSQILQSEYHSPVLMSLGKVDARRRSMWRFNAWYCRDVVLMNKLKIEIAQYFLANEHSVISPGTLWAAGKATVRGVAKALVRQQERDKLHHITTLEERILRAEIRIGSGETGAVERQLALDRSTLTQTLLEEAKTHWRASTQRVYASGDKNGKLLYWLAAGNKTSQIVPSVVDGQGILQSRSSEIVTSFAAYYKKLYAPGARSNAELERPLLGDIPLPRLARAAANSLEAPFTLEEVERAIGDINIGKTPGPDGFPAEYFRSFRDLLGPHLLNFFVEAVERMRFPAEVNLATIVVLLKQGHPPEQCASYRPISLINTELKIYAKLLATRLMTVLPTLIHSDQCGFMPARGTRHCIRRLHSAMAQIETLPGSRALVLLDFEKAFDTVDWNYLDFLLERLGFGPFFRRSVRALYQGSSAQVRVNGHLSEPFLINRGTRQGCPLSPLLFALAIEPLARSIRIDAQIWGWEIPGGGEDRIALYADDILLYLSEVKQSGPRVLKILSLFQDAAGLRVNRSKSVLVPLRGDREDEGWAHGFSIQRLSFKYLGITVSVIPGLAWSRNISPLIKHTKDDLRAWAGLPLNVLGRIALLKMMVLPRFLYILQNFPWRIPAQWFHTTNSLFRTFIWGKGPARIAFAKCCQSTYDGGMAMINIRLYYWAAHLIVINDWISGGWSDSTYARELKPMGIEGVMGIMYGRPISENLPEMTQIVFLAWRGALRWTGWDKKLTLATPLWVGSWLSHTANLQGFLGWDRIGISLLGDVVERGEIKSFSTLQEEFSLDNSQFFRYLQLRHTLQQYPSISRELEEFNPLEAKLLLGAMGRGGVSRLYRSLVINSPECFSPLRERWESYVGPLEEEDWREARMARGRSRSLLSFDLYS